jgi:hypothetical protein
MPHDFGFTLSLRMRDFFFDRQAIVDRLSQANRRALSKVGAFLRRRARSSLRRRKSPSPPGNPPSVHSDDNVATLKNILFAYEPEHESLVVGPVALNQRFYIGPQLGSATVPQLQEFGSRVRVREVQIGQKWFSGIRRVRPGQKTRVRAAKYPPRPFMGPALEAERQNIPEAWAGTVSN